MRHRILYSWLLLFLTACASLTRMTPQEQIYAAAIQTFFQNTEGHGPFMRKPAWREVYIRPTFTDIQQSPVPASVLEMIVAETARLGFTQVDHEPDDGIIIELSPIALPNPVFGRQEPLISIGVTPQEAGHRLGFVLCTYTLRPSDSGWYAEPPDIGCGMEG